MSADKQLKAYIDRVLRLKEEQDTIGDDIREVYAEAKGEGYDKTVMGKLVAHLRKVAKSGEDAVSEQADIFDTYLTAYHRASGTPVATHTHEENYHRETGEVLDTNPRLIKQVVDGMQTEAGRAALIAAVDIMIEREETEDQASHGEKAVRPTSAGHVGEESPAANQPETAEQAEPEAAAEVAGDDLREPAAAEQGQIIREGDAPRETGRFGGGASSPDTDFAPASHGEAEALSVDAPKSHGSSADANTGGGHVDATESHAAQAGSQFSSSRPATPGFTNLEISPPYPMKRSSFAHCFPELSKAAYDELFIAIDNAGGIEEPIIRQGDVILDGWARFNIARGLGDAYPVQEYDGDDALLDVIALQRADRDFTPAQERKIAAELAKEIPHRADDIMKAFAIAEEMA